jgi:hypothetical protein
MDIFRLINFRGEYIQQYLYYVMGYIETNSLKPKKSITHLNVGDIFLTFNGYMKVNCLTPLTLIPLVVRR